MINIHWSPRISDPTLMGWLTVMMYFTCSLLSLRVYRHSSSIFVSARAKQKKLWLAIGLIMLLLGLNKLLSLQSLFIDIARHLAYEQGWYAERRYIQETFIFTIVALGATGLLLLAMNYARVMRAHVFAILGICFLITFVVVRSASFHFVDQLIDARFLMIRVNWVLEIGGISLVMLNALQLKPLRLKKSEPLA